MATITKRVRLNVTLSKSEIARVNKLVVDQLNISKACEYAELNYRTFNRGLEGLAIKDDQRDKLLKFCDIVEGVKK